MPPAVVALAPVIASGVSQIVKHKQAKAAEKQAAAYELQQNQAKEASDRATFEASQNSPQAQLARQSFNMKLGKLLGAAGGRDKLPPSLLAGYDAARKAQEYTPTGPAYVPKPQSKTGLWDIVGGVAEAASNYDPSGVKSAQGLGKLQGLETAVKTNALQELLKKRGGLEGASIQSNQPTSIFQNQANIKPLSVPMQRSNFPQGGYF